MDKQNKIVWDYLCKTNPEIGKDPKFKEAFIQLNQPFEEPKDKEVHPLQALEFALTTVCDTLSGSRYIKF